MYVTEEEYQIRRERLRKAMEERSIDALLVWGEPHGSLGLLSTKNYIGYLVNWSIRQPGTGPALLVFLRERGLTLLVSGPRYSRRYAERRTNLTDIRQTSSGLFVSEARNILKEGNVNGPIGVVDYDALPNWLGREIQGSFSEVNDVTNLVDTLRIQKSPAERDRLRAAASVTDQMFERLEKVAGAGVSQRKIMTELEYVARSSGAEFANVWVSSGSMGDPIPVFEPIDGGEHLSKGNLLVCGVHIVMDNYWGHAIRPAIVDEPSPRQQELIDVVGRARDVILDRVRPGATVAELYAATHSVYENHGYQSSFRTIHGLGLQYGGSPSFPQPGQELAVPETTLEAGMVFELHPNVHNDADEEAFCAIGDAVAVTEDGFEVLNDFPHDPLIL